MSNRVKGIVIFSLIWLISVSYGHWMFYKAGIEGDLKKGFGIVQKALEYEASGKTALSISVIFFGILAFLIIKQKLAIRIIYSVMIMTVYSQFIMVSSMMFEGISIKSPEDYGNLNSNQIHLKEID